MIDFQVFHLKLFLILGLSWTLESVHFIIHDKLYPKFFGVYIFFRVVDSCNLLRGFFFFIIFVCNKNTWGKIKHFWYLQFWLLTWLLVFLVLCVYVIQSDNPEGWWWGCMFESVGHQLCETSHQL